VTSICHNPRRKMEYCNVGCCYLHSSLFQSFHSVFLATSSAVRFVSAVVPEAFEGVYILAASPVLAPFFTLVLKTHISLTLHGRSLAVILSQAIFSPGWRVVWLALQGYRPCRHHVVLPQLERFTGRSSALGKPSYLMILICW
jgi:hypothetical protein